MDELTQHLNKIKVPTRSDKIYKDECVLSFDNPVSNNCYPLHILLIISMEFIVSGLEFIFTIVKTNDFIFFFFSFDRKLRLVCTSVSSVS